MGEVMNIIELAKTHLVRDEHTEFGWQECHKYSFDEAELSEFAALVAAHEREACADIAENWHSNGSPRVGVAAQIRARGAT
jgi:hypothetical protein